MAVNPPPELPPVAVEVTAETQALIQDLAMKTPYSEIEIYQLAAKAIFRKWVGAPTGEPPCAEGEVPTGERGPKSEFPPIPFKKLHSDKDADVVLRQLDAESFCLDEGFRYIGDASEIEVPGGRGATDLASVPGFLTWLIPRYGRHTFSALLHDFEVADEQNMDVRETADTRFRDTLTATLVPFVRRWAMWGAVSLQTYQKRGVPHKALLIIWAILFGGSGLYVGGRIVQAAITSVRERPLANGLALLIFGLGMWILRRERLTFAGAFSSAFTLWKLYETGDPWVLLALASPLALSILWGPKRLLGLVSGIAFLILPLPVVTVLFTYGIYLGLEGVAFVAGRALGKIVRIETPPVRLSKLK